MPKNSENRLSRLRRILDDGNGWIHMTGVLGASMSSLAKMLLERGIDVSGSDDDSEHSLEELAREGVHVDLDRRIALCCANALVYSSAIPEDHPDRRIARKIGIPEYSRAELLGALMQGYENRIGISGTHGKSTTTAMLAKVFGAAELSPTVLCGARIDGIDRYIPGGRDYLIYEACEYRDSFLHFSPTCAIITNIEMDHTDYFKSSEALRDSFLRSCSAAGRAVVSADYKMSADVAIALSDKAVTVGRSPDAMYRYKTLSADSRGSIFALYHGNECLAELSVGAIGEHNVDNAAIAAVTAMLHGVSSDAIARGLESFRGVDMRLELLGELDGRAIYRDYAHHPTEIRCAISTLKSIYPSVAVLFRPHTYTRTRDLWGAFVGELSRADEVGIYEIYPAREMPIEGVSSEALAREINGAVALDEKSAASFVLGAGAAAVILMGAGDLDALEREISRRIKEKEQ